MSTKITTKKTVNFPEIQGFERFPNGKLLTQRVDFSRPIAIAYERCIGYSKSKHAHDRITITFPRSSSRSFIKVFPESKNFPLNEDLIHFMSKDHVHEQGSISTIYDTFALFVTESYFESHLKKMRVPNQEYQQFLRTTQSFPKSPILTNLIARYFFCRILEKSPLIAEMEHLESLFLTEIFSLGRRKLKQSHSPVLTGATTIDNTHQTALFIAIEYIESNLFNTLNIQDLIQASQISQATLFRLFEKELKVSPMEYVRKRRMDEAHRLLQTGQYKVCDVAALVGYEDLSTFSKTYKLQFGIAPSYAFSKVSANKY